MMVSEIPGLRRYARFLVCDVNIADDLVQGCLTQAISGLALWDPASSMRAWLLVTLHDLYRRERPVVTRKAADVKSKPSQNRPATPVTGISMESPEFQNALLKLDDSHQQVLLMIGMDGLSYEDTAAALRESVDTVRDRLVAAHEEMKTLIGQALPNDADSLTLPWTATA